MNMFRGKSRNFRRPATVHHPTACCGGEDSRNFKKFLEMKKKLIRFMKMCQAMVNCIEITSRRLGVDFKQKRCHLGCFFQEISRNFQEILRNFLNNR